MRESETNPFLQGNFAPWRLEGTADDLEVTGTIPAELNGTFYRNGPNPAYEPVGRYHWFDATLGELYRRAGDLDRARRHFQSAQGKTHSSFDRELLDRRLGKCGKRGE